MTKTELFLDFIGLICAAGAGAAQVSRAFLPLAPQLIFFSQKPLMSLIFGRLTQDFVNFQIVRAQAEAGTPEGIAALPEAAVRFRKASALDASYLVYIGILHSLINLR